MKSKMGTVLEEKKGEAILMHGQCNRRTYDRHIVREENTVLWLWRGDLKAETQSKIASASQTKYHAIKILQT